MVDYDRDHVRAHYDITMAHLRTLLEVIVKSMPATTLDNTIEIPDDDPLLDDVVDLLLAAGLLYHSPYGTNWYEVAYLPQPSRN